MARTDAVASDFIEPVVARPELMLAREESDTDWTSSSKSNAD
jgi:hypothetical protein